MRRLLGSLLVVALLVPALAAAGTNTEDYYDGFHEGNYSGNIGSLDFDGPWVEFNDPGGGGHSGGWVHVGPENCSSNSCLHIEGDGLFLESFGVMRYADLSDFESVDLSYEIEIDPEPLTTTKLLVQVFDGNQWKTLKEYDLSVATSHHKVLGVSDYANAEFGVRFVVSDLVSGGVLGLDILYTGDTTIDNVRLQGHVPGEGTTSTTSTSTPTTSTTSTTSTSTSTSSTFSTSTSSTTSTSTSSSTTTSVPGSEGSSSTSAPSTTVAQSTASTDTAPESTNGDGATTTTIVASSSTSTTPLPLLSPPPTPPADSGLRDPGVGLMADYETGMMGDMGFAGDEVLGIELDAEFSIAAELFETAKLWIAILALLITAAVVSGMDRRRIRAATAD